MAFSEHRIPPPERQPGVDLLEGWLEDTARPSVRASTYVSHSGVVRHQQIDDLDDDEPISQHLVEGSQRWHRPRSHHSSSCPLPSEQLIRTARFKAATTASACGDDQAAAPWTFGWAALAQTRLNGWSFGAREPRAGPNGVCPRDTRAGSNASAKGTTRGAVAGNLRNQPERLTDARERGQRTPCAPGPSQ